LQNKTVDEIYRDLLSDMKYKPDFNINFRYRSFIYIIAICVAFILYVYIVHKIGLVIALSIEGLKIFAGYIFVNTSLVFSWIFDYLSEISRKDDKNGIGIPPFHKVRLSPFSRRRIPVIGFFFKIIHISINIFSKLIALIVRLSFELERYTETGQAPKILYWILFMFSLSLNLLALLLQKLHT